MERIVLKIFEDIAGQKSCDLSIYFEKAVLEIMNSWREACESNFQ
ncbi:hypothetical protein B4168_0343 [Anoxybacillus flavithermus]|nr:hypothetical protein B4168_0343 [Anoxybacillus flavithermus]OAO83754.1 hypothetical protein GT23_4064 [Parageobacillus thermoglucosidasius]